MLFSGRAPANSSGVISGTRFSRTSFTVQLKVTSLPARSLMGKSSFMVSTSSFSSPAETPSRPWGRPGMKESSSIATQ